MTTEHALIGGALLLFLHAAIERWRLRRRLWKLEHCVFSVSSLNGKVTHLTCRCTGKEYPP